MYVGDLSQTFNNIVSRLAVVKYYKAMWLFSQKNQAFCFETEVRVFGVSQAEVFWQFLSILVNLFIL